MPRACYGDRHAVTVRLGTTKHVAFELTSKVIDFFTTTASIDEKGIMRILQKKIFFCYYLLFEFILGCSFLIILAEEEIVCIDLSTEDWPLVQLPYLVSIHASAITFTTFVSDINEDLWNNIIEIGNLQNENNFSSNVSLNSF